MLECPFVLESPRGWPIRGELRRLEGSGRLRLVVISHGFKGFKDWGFFPEVARRLAVAGYTAVTFNFSGNGIGEDPLQFTEAERFRGNTLTRELEDLSTVLGAALEGGLEGLPASTDQGPALLGHSRGGMISVVMAARDARVRRIVTWNGVGELSERFPAPMRAEWRRKGFVEVVNSRTGQVLEMGMESLRDLESHLTDFAPVHLAPTITTPWLILHGVRDRSVPFEEAEATMRAARAGVARLVPIPDGDHTLGIIHPYQQTTAQLDEAVRETLQFLGELDAAK